VVAAAITARLRCVCAAILRVWCVFYGLEVGCAEGHAHAAYERDRHAVAAGRRRRRRRRRRMRAEEEGGGMKGG
jgi:hypothetical protein